MPVQPNLRNGFGCTGYGPVDGRGFAYCAVSGAARAHEWAGPVEHRSVWLGAVGRHEQPSSPGCRCHARNPGAGGDLVTCRMRWRKHSGNARLAWSVGKWNLADHPGDWDGPREWRWDDYTASSY